MGKKDVKSVSVQNGGLDVIYLDHAATTSVHPEVIEEMTPYFGEKYGNPSGIYEFASDNKKKLQSVRAIIAESIGALPDEIYFTSGGSESDNWAIKSVAETMSSSGMGKHIITSSIEHHAVLNTCRYLETKGYEVTYIGVDKDGIVSVEEIASAIRSDTVLISVMTANNEVGTIEPIEEIGELAHSRGIVFHTDAVQSYGHIPLNVNEMNIDMLSASAHKFGGPKGVGFLYVKRDVKMHSFIHGGAQERGRRAGTYNVPGIVGMGKASELCAVTMSDDIKKEIKLREHLIGRVLSEIEGVYINGTRQKRLPGNINFYIENVEGQSLLILLDQKGICVSSGSACTSGSLDPSHVLKAMGQNDERARGSVRITLSSDNTLEQIDYVADELKRIVNQLRAK